MNDDKVSDFSKRLSYAMDIRNMKQVDLVEKTGIKKASMSHYVRGIRTDVSLDVISTLADALDVNPVWLIGYDVPMESSITYSRRSADLLMNSLEDESTRQVIEIMDKLDGTGKAQVVQYAAFILSQKKSTT